MGGRRRPQPDPRVPSEEMEGQGQGWGASEARKGPLPSSRGTLGDPGPGRGLPVPHRGHERGQASVELALCLPFVAVLLLLVAQAGLLVADQVAVVQGAREAARRASVDPDPEAARRAALGGRLVAGRTTVVLERVPGTPERARATVRHRAATDVPIVGRVVPDVELAASAAMAVEGG